MPLPIQGNIGFWNNLDTEVNLQHDIFLNKEMHLKDF